MTLSRPLAAVRRWLRGWMPDALADEVERRMAPALQLLFLFYGLALPGNWAWQLADRPLPAGWGVVLGTDLLTAVTALLGVLQIRRGHLRRATQAFIGALLLAALSTWHLLGASAMLIDQTALLLVLVVAGLVLGRGALWTTYATILVVIAAGLHTDYHAGRDAQWTANALRNGPSLGLAYLIIAFMLDNTATALRKSLHQARDRSAALDQQMQIRERLQQQLLHAQKLDGVGRLTSGVAHDFNNVLAVVSGFCEERHRFEPDADRREAALLDALDGIALAARRGEHISRALLRFSRQDLPLHECFAVDQALDELRPLLHQMFGRRIRLQIAPVPAGAALCMDRSQFDLALLNLAANARDAIAGTGHVAITVDVQADRVQVSMADDGSGMDAATCARIFEPFFSTKPRDHGTGLGLPVVRDVLEAAGGTITVESTVGRGTRILLELPLAQGVNT